MTKKDEIKLPKKDAIAKIRETADKLRNQAPSPELVDALKRSPAKPEEKSDRKIAASKKPHEPDLGI
jgi:hypothetical protein